MPHTSSRSPNSEATRLSRRSLEGGEGHYGSPGLSAAPGPQEFSRSLARLLARSLARARALCVHTRCGSPGIVCLCVCSLMCVYTYVSFTYIHTYIHTHVYIHTYIACVCVRQRERERENYIYTRTGHKSIHPRSGHRKSPGRSPR